MTRFHLPLAVTAAALLLAACGQSAADKAASATEDMAAAEADMIRAQGEAEAERIREQN